MKDGSVENSGSKVPLHDSVHSEESESVVDLLFGGLAASLRRQMKLADSDSGSLSSLSAYAVGRDVKPTKEVCFGCGDHSGVFGVMGDEISGEVSLLSRWTPVRKTWSAWSRADIRA